MRYPEIGVPMPRRGCLLNCWVGIAFCSSWTRKSITRRNIMPRSGLARRAKAPSFQPTTIARSMRQVRRPVHSKRLDAVLQVLVRDNYVDQALRALKRKMQREGIFREMKQRKAYEKPSERKTREKAEAVRRNVQS